MLGAEAPLLELLAAGKWQQVMQRAATSANDGPEARAVQSAALIASIHAANDCTAWFRILGLDTPPAATAAATAAAAFDAGDATAGSAPSAGNIWRQFRRLAARVHPDKCDLPHAESAFKLLAAACQSLATNAAVAPVPAPSVSSGRGRSEGGAPPEGEGDFNWWDPWDDDADECASPGGSRQQPQPGQGGPQAGGSATAHQSSQPRAAEAPPSSSTGPPEEDNDESHLRSMSLEALRSEVARRQAELLAGPAPSQPAPDAPPSVALPVHDRVLAPAPPLASPPPPPLSRQKRQARLKLARAILADRLRRAPAGDDAAVGAPAADAMETHRSSGGVGDEHSAAAGSASQQEPGGFIRPVSLPLPVGDDYYYHRAAAPFLSYSNGERPDAAESTAAAMPDCCDDRMAPATKRARRRHS